MYNEEEEVEQETRGMGEEGWEKSRKNRLRILQWNADGINTKKAELEEYMKSKDIDIAVIQETKLGEKSGTPIIKGYTTIRKDRVVLRKSESRKGGGLMILVKKDIPVRRLRGWKGGTTEGLRVKVYANKQDSINILNICQKDRWQRWERGQESQGLAEESGEQSYLGRLQPTLSEMGK